jgi:hypothetical protein
MGGNTRSKTGQRCLTFHEGQTQRGDVADPRERNKDTELRMIALFRTYGITGWRRGLMIFGKPDFAFPARTGGSFRRRMLLASASQVSLRLHTEEQAGILAAEV